MTTWAIKDWSKLFQKADLREGRVAEWKYVPVPIRLNGSGYKRLMKSSKGREAFAVFIALAELAANMPTRGVLADEEGPLSVETISLKISVPEKVIEAAIVTLSEKPIGWLIPADGRDRNGEPPREERQTVALPHPPSEGVTGTQPQPHPAAVAAVVAHEGEDSEAAYRLLTAAPFPDMGPSKARLLCRTVSVRAVMAAVAKGRSMRERGETVGAGLIAHWLESGDAEAWAKRDLDRHRDAARKNWSRTQDGARNAWRGRYEAQKGYPPDESSDEFLDWLNGAVVELRGPSRRGTQGGAA